MSDAAEPRLGLSGAIAKKFLLSEITPLLALVGLLMGLFAVLVTPREEEPQINVTFANVFIPFPGATAREVEKLVSSPAEQVLAEIEGVEHIYSVSQPGMAVLTVQFFVGEPRTDAIVRLYNKLYSNADWLPPNLGVGQPIVKPKGIDDVPIVSLTLWTEDPQRSADDLARVAHTLETELKRVAGTRDLYTIGAPDRVVRVLFDPAKLAGYGLSLAELRRSLQAANASTDAGALVSDNREIPVQAGSFLPECGGDRSVSGRAAPGDAGVSGRCRRGQTRSGFAGTLCLAGNRPSGGSQWRQRQRRVSRSNAGDRQKARRKRRANCRSVITAG